MSRGILREAPPLTHESENARSLGPRFSALLTENGDEEVRPDRIHGSCIGGYSEGRVPRALRTSPQRRSEKLGPPRSASVSTRMVHLGDALIVAWGVWSGCQACGGRKPAIGFGLCGKEKGDG
jgi:hypothetical protein